MRSRLVKENLVLFNLNDNLFKFDVTLILCLNFCSSFNSSYKNHRNRFNVLLVHDLMDVPCLCKNYPNLYQKQRIINKKHEINFNVLQHKHKKHTH